MDGVPRSWKNHETISATRVSLVENLHSRMEKPRD